MLAASPFDKLRVRVEKSLMLSLSKHESGAALDGPGKPGHDK
jgi:hypothetical protein